MESNCWWPSL